MRPRDQGRRSRFAVVRLVALGLAVGLLAIAVAACGTASAAPNPMPAASPVAAAAASAVPGATVTPAPTPSPTAEPKPLTPSQPGADPVSLLAWLFTPIFQGLFLVLAGAYAVTGNIGLAIIILTLIIRFATIRLSARQIVSQQRMYRLQPELKALQARYKGDRARQMQAQQEFYKERGISPTAGCLPSLLQMGLLIPMFYVIRDGLTSFDPSAMLRLSLPFAGNVQVVPLTCPNPAHIDAVTHVVNKALPCINTVLFGIDTGKPQVLFDLNLGFFALGISALAIVSALLQLVQSRMLMPPAAENDPSASTQRTMMIFLPLISILYGGIFPAGLFIYWITTSLFSIVQQFLIVGWGSMFPIFGWTPAFARSFTPRFPVTMPVPVVTGNSVAASRRRPDDRAASAAATVRPHARGRQGRRGRRR